MKKILLEVLVILVSILLAFGIDATWADRQVRKEQDRLLRALVDEIEENAVDLEYRRARGAAALAAQRGLIDLIGPRTGAISADSLGALIRTAMNFGTAEVESAALESVLAWTATPTPSRTHLLRLLRRYRTELEDHRLEDRRQWIDNRAIRAQHLVAVSPFAFVWAEPTGHSPTDFDVPVAALLRDQEFEGLVSNLSVRTRLMAEAVETLSVLADSIAGLTRAELR
ncbi:MAG TPA: hypothetical protein VK858_03095 [Longimicrobiales bacterium]|nr:hypothetical protein [Longimicrobiales bacterium]